MKKELLKFAPWVALVLVMLMGKFFLEMRIENRLLKAQAGQLIQVNKNSTATIAQLKSENAELKLSKTAAHDMGGKLVGGVKIVHKMDTVYYPVTTWTTIRDSTGRRADHLFMVAEGDAFVHVEAPATGDLKIGLDWKPNPFEPEVGLVKKGDEYYWVVSWQGQRLEAKEAFYKPPREHLINFLAGASVAGIVEASSLANFSGSPYLKMTVRATKDTNVGLQSGVLVPGAGAYIQASIEKRIGGLF